MDGWDERKQTRWIDGGYRDVVVPWTETRSGHALTLEQKHAAQLLAELEFDVGRVEEILGLKKGQVEAWMDDEDFSRVFDGIYEELHPGAEEEFDFSKVLKPKQLEAAHLYFEQALTKVEVARRLQITDRTLWNWASDPAFQRYGNQLRKARDRLLSQELEAHEGLLRAGIAERRRQALDVLGEALEQKDLKAAMEVLRPWLRER
jgi:hypothetical protein